jgi:hypothetical protein
MQLVVTTLASGCNVHMVSMINLVLATISQSLVSYSKVKTS